MFVGAAIAVGCVLTPFQLSAQNVASAAAIAPLPDFSGVYYPANEGRGGAGRREARRRPAPAAVRRLVPRNQPPLGRLAGPVARRAVADAEYLAKWEVMRKSRIAGSYEYDNSAKCLPPGMPAMMNMAYGMEVMQTKDKITFFSELNDALRRVYLDGRKPTQKILDDPTYAGYSTGHWEGDTLVVDTVALNDATFIEGFTPHSTAMTVKERIRFNSAGLLEDHIVVTDPSR